MPAMMIHADVIVHTVYQFVIQLTVQNMNLKYAIFIHMHHLFVMAVILQSAIIAIRNDITMMQDWHNLLMRKILVHPEKEFHYPLLKWSRLIL